MQAIQTKWFGATNCRGARIKASCARGSITISTSELEGDGHVAAADALVAKFIAEDAAKYGSKAGSNPWSLPRVCGELPDGTQCHVFITPASLLSAKIEELKSSGKLNGVTGE